MAIASVEESALAERLRNFRRHLHQHPELSLEEVQTTASIVEFLKDSGIEVLSSNLPTGTFALVRGKRPGPCVAIRTDIDALPIVEQTGLPYASTIEGKMHACGHDFHTASVLGAAWLAQQWADSEESFAGSILFVFQPAEEVGAGAKQVVASGVLQEQGVRCIFGEHNNPLLERGYIGVKSGPLMGSVDDFRIVVRGTGGHAAIPQTSVDPILVAAHLVTGLQSLVSRNVSPLHSAVVTVGQLHAGTARNIIPEEAVLEGTVRTLQPENRDLLEERLKTLAFSTAAAFGASAEVDYERQLPVTESDEAMAGIVREAAQHVVGVDAVVEAMPTLGGEDFSIYGEHLPSCFFWVGTGKPDGSSRGWHHPQFDVDEAQMLVASKIFVEAARRALVHFSK